MYQKYVIHVNSNASLRIQSLIAPHSVSGPDPQLPLSPTMCYHPACGAHVATPNHLLTRPPSINNHSSHVRWTHLLPRCSVRVNHHYKNKCVCTFRNLFLLLRTFLSNRMRTVLRELARTYSNRLNTKRIVTRIFLRNERTALTNRSADHKILTVKVKIHLPLLQWMMNFVQTTVSYLSVLGKAEPLWCYTNLEPEQLTELPKPYFCLCMLPLCSLKQKLKVSKSQLHVR